MRWVQVMVTAATNAVIFATQKGYLVAGPPQPRDAPLLPVVTPDSLLLIEEQTSFLDTRLDPGIISHPFDCRLVLLPLHRRKDKPVSATKVFGISLELLSERERCDIPRVVSWCIEYLSAGERFKLEGIFRHVRCRRTLDVTRTRVHSQL